MLHSSVVVVVFFLSGPKGVSFRLYITSTIESLLLLWGALLILHYVVTLSTLCINISEFCIYMFHVNAHFI